MDFWYVRLGKIFSKLIISYIVFNFFIFLVTLFATNCCFIIFSEAVYSMWDKFWWGIITKSFGLFPPSILPSSLLLLQLEPLFIPSYLVFDLRDVCNLPLVSITRFFILCSFIPDLIFLDGTLFTIMKIFFCFLYFRLGGGLTILGIIIKVTVIQVLITCHFMFFKLHVLGLKKK